MTWFRVVGAVLLGSALIAGCQPPEVDTSAAPADPTSTAPSPIRTDGSDTSTTAASTSSDAPTATPEESSTSPQTATGTRPDPAAEPSGPCAAYPTASCTGVPAGTQLRILALNDDNAVYRVTTPNQVLDGVHIPGDLLLTANGTTIRNSQIDGRVLNEFESIHYPFTITGSTIGPAVGCNTGPAVGEAGYRASRLYIRNQGDGFRVSGSDVTAEDSFVLLCSRPGFHSDGVQDYPGGDNVVIQHNTIDQRLAPDATAPIFLTSSYNVLIDDNLVMGGTWPLRVENRTGRGKITVQRNQIVDKAWAYGPADIQCNRVTFTGNQLVRIDNNYKVTRVVEPLACPQ